MPTSHYDEKLKAVVIALKRKYLAPSEDPRIKGKPTRGKK